MATSLLAASQSSRDRRFPLRTSIRAPGGRLSIIASTPASSLEGRTKQTRLRNPRSSRHWSTRDPMKPAAPVTRIRSFGPITKQSCDGNPHSLLPELVSKVVTSRPLRGHRFQCFCRKPCQRILQNGERRSGLPSASYGFAIASLEDCRRDQPRPWPELRPTPSSPFQITADRRFRNQEIACPAVENHAPRTFQLLYQVTIDIRPTTFPERDCDHASSR